MFERMQTALDKIKHTKPLVLCLTNYVTMDLVANTLLALGACPIMSEEKSELAELVSLSQSVYINIGNVNTAFIERMETLLLVLKQQKKPLILDPVGAGATHLRTQTAKQCLPFVDCIRGNASEIANVMGQQVITQGVESGCEMNDTLFTTASTFAKQQDCTVVISGAVDFVTDGQSQQHVPFGTPLMQSVTGMGCALTAVIAAFRAVVEDSYEAALLATTYFGMCGTVAAQSVTTPAHFRTHFIDTLYTGVTVQLQSLCER